MQPQRYTAQLLESNRLAAGTAEVVLGRPAAFGFSAGQRIRVRHQGCERDYSLVSAPSEARLVLCVRVVKKGGVSQAVADASPGTAVDFSGPYGYFTFRPSPRPALFVATGTGVAPFVSMVRAGVRPYSLLHGVRHADERYYAELLQSSARKYVACLSGERGSTRDGFPGRVTDYLAGQLPPGRYDFYLCGRREMIRDVTWIVDERFPGSLVYSELFF